MCFLLVLGLLVLIPSVEAKLEENVVQVYWDGVSMYIPVSREKVQKKLDEWHESNSEFCESPRLFLPNYRVFPNLMKEDQHPIYIDFGYVTFKDFVNKTDPFNPLGYGIQVTVSIPLLTSAPDGPPSYSLGVGVFFERSRGDIPKPNINYPYIAVDKMTFDDKGFHMKNGCEEMKVSFQKQHYPCVPPSDVVRHEFDAVFNTEFYFGVAESHFDYCDRHPTLNNFCSTAERLKCAVYRNAPNLCEVWFPANATECNTSVEEVRMTEGFRKFSLIGDGPINSVTSVTVIGNLSVGFKYPCIE